MQDENMPSVVIGVDVLKARLNVGRSDGARQIYFSNDKAGYKALVQKERRRHGTVIIGLEPTGG
jgi:transposase